MSELRLCQIPAPIEECGDTASSCLTCPFKDRCDYVWIAAFWRKDDRTHKGHGLLGPPWPGQIKGDLRNNHIYTYGKDNDNFVVYGINKKKRHITVQDIYVDDSARGKGYARKILTELLEEVNKDLSIEDSYDLFAKAVRGTSAEEFWNHVATRIHPDVTNDPNDWYEHPAPVKGKPRRDLAWFKISRKPIKQEIKVKKTLW